MKLGNLAGNYPTSLVLQGPKQSLRALSVAQEESSGFAGRQNCLRLGPSLRSGCQTLSTSGSQVSYLGFRVTVNALLEMFVSLPPKLAEPVLENVPATVGTKLTVMTQVWPPGKLARLQLETPARNRTIPPQLALAYETAENRPSALPLRSVLLAHSTAFLLSPKPSCSKISGEDLLLRGSFRASFRVCASSTTVPLEARLFSLHLSKRASRPAGMSGSRSIPRMRPAPMQFQGVLLKTFSLNSLACRGRRD